MQKLVDIEFDHKPNDVEVYKTGVDVITKCEYHEKHDEMSGETYPVWICDIDRYEPQEYILYQMAEHKKLEQQLNDTQLALCDVYEMILS